MWCRFIQTFSIDPILTLLFHKLVNTCKTYIRRLFSFVIYPHTSNLSHTLVGTTIVDHSDVVGTHDDVIKWKYFPRYWPFVRGIHQSPVNSPHKGQWRGALMFTLICARINGWVNNHEAGDLRRHRAHYDVTANVIFFHFVRLEIKFSYSYSYSYRNDDPSAWHQLHLHSRLNNWLQ